MEITDCVEYERDDRSDSFRMVGDIIATVAENRSIAVDDTTRKRWGDLLSLLREFDTLVDDSQMPANEALIELALFERFKDNYPSLGPPEVDLETHLKMVRRVALILEHGQYIRQTVDTAEFLHHRREEVDHTAELLADCATSDVTTQPGFYTNFMPMLRNMGEAANYIDTLLDFRQDRNEGKLTMPASTKFFRAVGSSAIREFARASPILTSPKVLWQFHKMSVMRLNNRLHHGNKPYSSIKNIHQSPDDK